VTVYRIKEKFWSWGGTFDITDEAGTPVYRVKGKAFSWGDKLSFQDLSHNEIAFINQKLFSLKPRYEINYHGQMVAELVKEFSWFKKKFTLDIPGPNDYFIEGSFWEHEFSVNRAEGEVARISKKLFSWRDSYGVQIVDGEDDPLILCACIVIDQILENENSSG